MSLGGTITEKGTAADVFIPEVWATGTLDAMEMAAVIAKRCTREYEGSIKNGGDYVRVPRISNLTANTLATNANIGTEVQFEAVTETAQTITINTRQYAAFLLSDVVEVQANVDLRSKYEKKIGYALARAREVALSALFASFSTSTGTLGVEPTADDYLYIWQKFAEAGLTGEGTDLSNISIFLTPAAYAATMKIDVFINKDYNDAANATQKMQVGNIYTMDVVISNLLTASGAGYQCGAFAKEGVALCAQTEVDMKSQYVIQNLSWAVVGSSLYGVAEINFPPTTEGGGAAVDNRCFLLNTV